MLNHQQARRQRKDQTRKEARQRANELAAIAQAKAQAKLESLGHRVKPTTDHVNAAYPYDLDVWNREGRQLRVEVKYAEAHLNGTQWRYQSRPHHHQADIYLLLCVTPEGNEHWYVIPMWAIFPRKSVTIWGLNPIDYGGQWAIHWETWSEINEPPFEF